MGFGGVAEPTLRTMIEMRMPWMRGDRVAVPERSPVVATFIAGLDRIAPLASWWVCIRDRGYGDERRAIAWMVSYFAETGVSVVIEDTVAGPVVTVMPEVETNEVRYGVRVVIHLGMPTSIEIITPLLGGEPSVRMFMSDGKDVNVPLQMVAEVLNKLAQVPVAPPGGALAG